MTRVGRGVALLLLLAPALSACGQEKDLVCNIYRTFGTARILVKSVKVKNRAECNALLTEAERGL